MPVDEIELDGVDVVMHSPIEKMMNNDDNKGLGEFCHKVVNWLIK